MHTRQSCALLVRPSDTTIRGLPAQLQTPLQGCIVEGMSDGVQIGSAQPSVHVRSSLPGRYRIWVAALYRNHELKRALESTLSASPTGRSAEANVVASTVLVRTSAHE